MSVPHVKVQLGVVQTHEVEARGERDGHDASSRVRQLGVEPPDRAVDAGRALAVASEVLLERLLQFVVGVVERQTA